MKKSDIAMIILIASIGVIGSYFITNSILGEGATEPVTVKTVESISAELEPVDPAIFNSEAINPAVNVQVTEQAAQ